MISVYNETEKKHGEHGGEKKYHGKNFFICSVFQTDMDKICMDKDRTGMIGKSKKVLGLSFSDFSVSVHIRGDLGSHWVAAEQSEYKRICAGGRQAEYFFP